MAEKTVTEYNANPEIEFIFEICASVTHKLNHHLWTGIVLPYLQEEVPHNPAAVKCLIQTIQNLYSSKEAHSNFDWVTEGELLECYLRMCPEDEWAISKAIEQRSRWLAYTIHEWPLGVLYGNNGATIEQCNEIIEAVSQLRLLDKESSYELLCKDIEDKTIQYQEQLQRYKASTQSEET